MAYVKQTWTNGDINTPLSGPRLTHIEAGVEAVDIAAAAATVEAETATTDAATALSQAISASADAAAASSEAANALAEAEAAAALAATPPTAAGLDTLGYVKGVFIANEGTLPGSLPIYAIVLEQE